MLQNLKKGYTFDDVLLLPQKSNIRSRKNTDISTKLTKNITLKNPIITSNMDTVTEHKMAVAVSNLGGVGIIHRFNTPTAQAKEIEKVKKTKVIDKNISSTDKSGRLLVGGAIGVKDDFIERTESLLRVGSDFIVVDIAHGHNIREIEVIKALRKKYSRNIEIIAGNIATPKGAIDLIKAGADGLKVGIGPGSMCTTRIVTGVGIPQLTAIDEIYRVSKKYKIPIIADGGIKGSGDIAKAIAVGADTVMIGSLIAGCAETPGEVFTEKGEKFKYYRGMASLQASIDKNKIDKFSKDSFTRTPEGVCKRVAVKGSAIKIIEELNSGLRSSMSYLGSKNLNEFRKNAKFIEITNSGFAESKPHGLYT